MPVKPSETNIFLAQDASLGVIHAVNESDGANVE